jgi:hypothetical protein
MCSSWTVFASHRRFVRGPRWVQRRVIGAAFRTWCYRNCLAFGPACTVALLSKHNWMRSTQVVTNSNFWDMTTCSPAKPDVSKEHNSSVLLCLQPDSLLLLAWLTLRSWRWERYVPPKHPLTTCYVQEVNECSFLNNFANEEGRNFINRIPCSVFPQWPPLWSSGQSFWLQIERSRVSIPDATRFSEK